MAPNTVVAMAKRKRNILDVKEERFVKFRQQPECLCDVSSQVYRDRITRIMTWNEIVDEFQAPCG